MERLLPGDHTLLRLLEPLKEALAKPGTREVVINSPGEFGVEDGDGWTWHSSPELTYRHLDAIGALVASRVAKRFGSGAATVSSFLPGRERITVVRPPATPAGVISVTIRRRAKDFVPTLEWLEDQGYFRGTPDHGAAWWQNAIDAEKTIVICGGIGCSKAQPLGARVLSPTGWRRMGDLKVGDLVRTPDGKSVPITGVFPQGEKDIYRISFHDGRFVECCDDHLWKVWTPKPLLEKGKTHATRKPIPGTEGGRWGVVALSKIRAILASGGQRAATLAVPLVEPFSTEMPEQVLPIEPYALGALIGDGSLGSGSIKLTTSDALVLERVMAALPSYEAVPTGHNNGLDYRLRMKPPRLHTTPLRRGLIALGLNETKSHDKFIPDVYKKGSVAQRLALLQGLMDTDGHVGFGGTHAVFVTTSERLALDVQEVVWSLGAVAKIAAHPASYVRKDGVRQGCRLSYRVSVIHPEVSAFFSLPRKVEKCNPKKMRHRLRIVDVTHVGRQHAQCIRVDHPDHLYITDDFVVTHNTTFAEALLRSISPKRRVVTIEDAPEWLNLPLINWVPLYFDGVNRTATDCLQDAMRMRPDDIPFQELRGKEAWAFLRARIIGHRTITTVHAASCEDAFDAVTLMVRQSDEGRAMEEATVQKLLRKHIDIVAHCAREPYRVTEVMEVRK